MVLVEKAERRAVRLITVRRWTDTTDQVSGHKPQHSPGDLRKGRLLLLQLAYSLAYS